MGDSSSSDGLYWIIDSDSEEDRMNGEHLNDGLAEQFLSLIQAQKRPASLSSRATRRFMHKDREEAHNRLFNDYFAEEPMYIEEMFRRRFRMRKHLFLRIVEEIGNYSDYFKLRYDGLGRCGFSPLTNCNAAIKMSAYGMVADCLDDYLKNGVSTTLECVNSFALAIIQLFGQRYLRKPKQDDIDCLSAVGEACDFPSCLGSIDCMHWAWKNFPTGWKGQYAKGNYKGPSLILEAIASYDLWIWHAFFEMSGSCNDINVLNHSPVFQESHEGRAPACEFKMNGNNYTMGYYPTDGIYPKLGTFVKTICLPQCPRAKLFAPQQEAVSMWREHSASSNHNLPLYAVFLDSWKRMT